MKTVKLGKTDLEISMIGIGGISIQRPPEDEAISVLQRCLDLGVTFIDTSPGYGDSEVRIGKAITDRRNEIIISTKGHWRDKKTAQVNLDRSLKRLNTDYIDLWQFQNVSDFERYDKLLGPRGGMEAAQEALQAGKIRHIGISTHSLDVALKAITSGYFEAVTFAFNFIANEAADELIPLARKHNIGFIAMKPFAGGMLKDANLAIKYLLQFEGVVSIPGIEKIGEIEEIVDIVNGPVELTLQERQKMHDIRAQLRTRFCRQCEICLPCPQEVFIPIVMVAPLLWKLWPQKLFLSGWIAEEVESGRNCNQCGECEEKCPYDLPIQQMIVENLEFYDRQ